jgi:uncharacterized protein (TIGR03437 family)
MAARTFLALAMLSTWTAMAADSSFLLGVDYSEWLTHGGGSPAVSQIATDSSGDLYIEWTDSFNASGSWVTKLSADGKTRLWENQLAFVTTTMAVDPAGGVYVIPVVQPPGSSSYVVKLSADGTGVAWKSPVGFYPPLAVDSQGRAYVAASHNGGAEVVRLNAAGSAVEYTAEVAGGPTSIAVDASGTAFVAGLRPTQESYEEFLAQLAPDGSAGFYTILAQDDDIPVVALDANGDAVVFSPAGVVRGVLRRVDSTGSVTLSTATSFAGGFAVDAAGNAYITGQINGQLYPVRNSLATCGSTLLSVFAPDGTILQTTYIPGAGSANYPALIATGPNSTVFLTTPSGAGFAPTQAGPFPAGSSGSNILLSLSLNANAQIQPLTCLGNAASYGTGPIAPGEMVTLIGNDLGPQRGISLLATLRNPLPKQAGNVVVTFGGTPAPLLWVQDAQINAVVPWSLTPGQTTQICVSYNGTPTNCLTWPVAQTAPGVFTMDGVYAYALNQDGTVNSAANPAPPGSIVAVWATGLGPITPVQADGSAVGFPLPDNVLAAGVEEQIQNQLAPTTFTTGLELLDVTYAGPAPYMVAGESQINFQIAATNAPLSEALGFLVTMPSAQSQQFLVYIAPQ